jgi:hypothetical protein
MWTRRRKLANLAALIFGSVVAALLIEYAPTFLRECAGSKRIADCGGRAFTRPYGPLGFSSSESRLVSYAWAIAPENREKAFHFPFGEESVEKLSEVRSICLRGQKVRGDDIRSLSVFSKLEDLYLIDCEVDDRALIGMELLPNLKLLDLTGTQVTDAGMKWLTHLRNLENLCLYSTAITDDALFTLATCPSLRVVFVRKTAVTSDCVKQFARYGARFSIVGP